MKLACSEFLEKQLDPANCVGIQAFAENHGCDSLQEAAQMFAFKYFEEVIQHEEFKALDSKDVENLINSDEIQVNMLFLYLLTILKGRLLLILVQIMRNKFKLSGFCACRSNSNPLLSFVYSQMPMGICRYLLNAQIARFGLNVDCQKLLF